MLLTVIVPVYNVKPYLDRCVQSIIQQTYKSLEIILVDDGSTDGSSEMCDQWAQKDSRIQVIHKKNGGLSSARNAGLDVAQGDFLSFIDSDDFVESDMYQAMMDALQNSGKDIACCGRIVDLFGKREKGEFSIGQPKIYTREEAMKEVLYCRDIDVSVCDKLFKKALFETLRYPDGKTSEDAAIIFQLLENTNGVIHVGRDFYHYIYRRGSISKATYSHAKYDAYENCIQITEFFEQKHPDLLRYVKIYKTRICAGLLEGMYSDTQFIKEYKQDFEAYRAMFKEGFLFTIRQKGVSVKFKVRLIFIRIGKINWFNRLKKLMDR